MATASIVHGQENNPQQKPATPPTNQTQPAANQPLSVTVVGPVSIEREQTVEPNWAKPNCEKPSNHDEADLCQQRSMAEAAQKTITLNYVQIAIGILTLLGLALTVHFTRRTADAAISATKIAERTLTELERPHIFVDVQEPGLIFAEAGNALGPRAFKYRLFNYGRTPGMLTELREDWRTVPKEVGALPVPIDPSVSSGRNMPAGVVVIQEKPYDLTTNLMAALDVTRIDKRPSRGENFFFIGFFRYRDIFDKRYVTGFCLMFDYVSGDFVPMGDDRYNYTKTESDTPPKPRWWRRLLRLT